MIETSEKWVPTSFIEILITPHTSHMSVNKERCYTHRWQEAWRLEESRRSPTVLKVDDESSTVCSRTNNKRWVRHGTFQLLDYYSMIQHKVISVIEISREWPSFVPVIISIRYYCIRYAILNLESGSKWSCSLFKFIFCTKLPVQKLVHAQILKFDWHLNRTQIALLGHTYICVFTRIAEDLEALISILIYYCGKCQSVW